MKFDLTKVYFLKELDKDFNKSTEFNAHKEPVFKNKLLLKDFTKVDEKESVFGFTPKHFAFRLEQPAIYSHKQDEKNLTNWAFAAAGEVVIGFSGVAVELIKYVNDDTTKRVLLGEIRVIGEDMTYRFMNCWITGVMFFEGGWREPSRGVQISFKAKQAMWANAKVEQEWKEILMEKVQ